MAVAAVVTAAPASAAVVTITYAGTLERVDDATQLFGGGAIDGADFIARIVIDDTLGTSAYGPAGSQYNVYYPRTMAQIGVTLTIGAVAFEFPCFPEAWECRVTHRQRVAPTSGLGTEVYVDGVWAGGHSYNELALGIFSPTGVVAPDADYHTPFSYTFQPGDQEGGFFWVIRRGPDVTSYAGLHVRSVTVTSEGHRSIPEPDAWAVMILGFGLAGGRLRHRRAPIATPGGQ